MKNKIYNIILIILIIALIIVALLITLKYTKNQCKEKELIGVVQEVKSKIEETKHSEQEVELEYEGYKVVGIIRIPKIEIEYPIIEKTNEQTMKVSITKFWGKDVNDKGNYTVAGHNNMDGTMFGKTKRLEIGDTIEMTDLNGNTIEYNIFSKYVTEPNDVSCVNSIEKDSREITLITCTNGRSNRLIIKAREMI